MAEIDSHYKKRDGKVLIEINLTSINQLFNSLDPAPFREKELDRAAEEYIVDTINDLPRKTEFSIVIHAPLDCIENGECPMIPDAIRNHFRYRALSEERHFRQRLRYGRLNLIVALVFLAVTLLIRNEIQQFGDGLVIYFLAEVFTIAGWVALWAPVTLLLYELYPIIQNKNLYERISRMEIELLPK